MMAEVKRVKHAVYDPAGRKLTATPYADEGDSDFHHLWDVVDADEVRVGLYTDDGLEQQFTKSKP